MRNFDGTRLRGAGFPTLALAVLAAAALTLGPPTRALAVPPAGPVFSLPLVITNTRFPFTPRSVKVFTGKKDGKRTTIVDYYLEETRTISGVACRVMQETEFSNGKVDEISRNHFAQADDGSVYYFGETVDIYDETGAITAHDGSWLVGGPSGQDPVETATATDPGLYMPAVIAVGDTFKPENLPGVVDETDLAQSLAKTVKVPAGRFPGCLQLRETSNLDGDVETKWYAPGLGVIKGIAKGEYFNLTAGTILGQ
jgi:hypothetical protein